MRAEDYYNYLKNNRETFTARGAEARVIKYNDYAVKLFHQDKTKAFMASKKAKVNELINESIKGFAAPVEVVYDQENQFRGYLMEYIEHTHDMFDICNHRDYTIKAKIEYLKKVEDLMKQTHNAGYIFNDCGIWNFLVNGEDVIGIDCDNFQFKQYKTETKPDFYLDYYKQLTNTEVNSINSDKFSYGVWAFNGLQEYPIKNEENFKVYRPNSDYFKIIIKNMLIPNDTKDYLIDFFSSNPDKLWMSDILETITNKDNPYIKRI